MNFNVKDSKIRPLRQRPCESGLLGAEQLGNTKAPWTLVCHRSEIQELPLSRQQGWHREEGSEERIWGLRVPLVYNSAILTPLGTLWTPALLSRLHSGQLGDSGWRDMGLQMPPMSAMGHPCLHLKPGYGFHFPCPLLLA